jgi:hypothetical protein
MSVPHSPGPSVPSLPPRLRSRARASQALYWELLEMFRKLAMAAIGTASLLSGGTAQAHRQLCADCRSSSQACLLWMAPSTRRRRRTFRARCRLWCSPSLASSSQVGVCACCTFLVALALTRRFTPPPVLYLALLLWHRPFERQLHNVVQAVRNFLTAPHLFASLTRVRLVSLRFLC